VIDKEIIRVEPSISYSVTNELSGRKRASNRSDDQERRREKKVEIKEVKRIEKSTRYRFSE